MFVASGLQIRTQKKGYHRYDNPDFQYFTLFLGWKMGFERHSRSEDTFKIYIILSSQPTIIFHLNTKAERCKRGFCWECFRLLAVEEQTQQKTQGFHLASAFGWKMGCLPSPISPFSINPEYPFYVIQFLGVSIGNKYTKNKSIRNKPLKIKPINYLKYIL